jgi:hypothetical protein
MKFSLIYNLNWDQNKTLVFKDKSPIIDIFKRIKSWVSFIDWYPIRSLKDFKYLKITEQNYDMVDDDWIHHDFKKIRFADGSIDLFPEPCKNLTIDFSAYIKDITESILKDSDCKNDYSIKEWKILINWIPFVFAKEGKSSEFFNLFITYIDWDLSKKVTIWELLNLYWIKKELAEDWLKLNKGNIQNGYIETINDEFQKHYNKDIIQMKKSLIYLLIDNK